jgi:hypothetical protein
MDGAEICKVGEMLLAFLKSNNHSNHEHHHKKVSVNTVDVTVKATHQTG